MGKVYVIGVGMTKFERPGVRNDPVTVLAKEALSKALDDAKISYSAIEQAYASYVYGYSTTGQRVLYDVGMTGIPIFNVHNYCSSGSTSLLLAKEAIEYGIKDCVLAIGFEKMKKGSLTFDYTPIMTSPLKRQIQRLYAVTGKSKAPFAAHLFGSMAQEHMKNYGSRPEHFAKIAFKNHKHGTVNPYSQSPKLYSLEEILNSRVIYEPLTLLQCCATTDGAAAAILASERFVIKHGLQGQAIEVLAMEMATDLPSTFTDDTSMSIGGYDMSRLAAYRSFYKTKLNPSDVDVVELHDCFSAHELILYEALGLCPPGKAADLVDKNDNTYGGKYVINPSGGLIGKGHPLGATGLAQCVELCWQLRGEADQRQVANAKLALQHNYSWGGAAFVVLYRRGFINHAINTLTITNTETELKQLMKILKGISDSISKQHDKPINLKVKMLYGKEYDLNIIVSNNKVLVEKNCSKVNPNIVVTVREGDIKEVIKKFNNIPYSDISEHSVLNDIRDLVLQKLFVKSKI